LKNVINSISMNL